MADEAKTDEPKNKVGRPLKFRDVAELQQKIDEYFGDCDPHQITRRIKVLKEDGAFYWKEIEDISEPKPYTIHGLARALKTNRQTLLNYEDPEHYPADLDAEIRDQLIDTIAHAKARIAEFAEGMLYVKGASQGAIFNLKNNYGWVDRHDVTTKDQPIPLLGALNVSGNDGAPQDSGAN